MSDEWLVTSDEWWIMKIKWGVRSDGFLKTKQPLIIFTIPNPYDPNSSFEDELKHEIDDLAAAMVDEEIPPTPNTIYAIHVTKST